LLLQEPNVAEVKSPQYLIGDVHGQFYDFLKMIKEVSTSMLSKFHSRVVAYSWETMSTEAIIPSKQYALF